MPVNFETPDPGIIERPYVQQIPLEALFKNMAFGQQEYDQNLQEAKRSVDTLRNIKTYGHDTAVKNQLFQKLDEELAKFDGADFRDNNVQMQIEGLINDFTKTREVAGMHARGSALEKMEREAEAARLKGEEYYNPGYIEAVDYYNNGVYRADARFNDRGNIAPDFTKLRDNILKMPQVVYKKTVQDKNGNVTTYDVVDEDKAGQAYLETLNNDPKFAEYIKYKFESAHPNVDWQEEGVKHFSEQFNYNLELKEAEEYAAALATNPQDKAYHLEAARAAEAAMQQYSTILDSADQNLGIDLKGIWFDEFKKNQAKTFGKTKALLTASKIDRDPAYLENLKHSNTMKELERKNFYDRGIDPETGEELKINPATVKSKTNAALTEKEEMEVGAALRKKYQQLVTADDIRALMMDNQSLPAIHATNPANPVTKEGDTWFVTTSNGSKYALMTEDRYVDRMMKGSALQMQQIVKDVNAQTQGKPATTPAP